MRVAVIGGGIAGLSAAFRLKQLGACPVVYEELGVVGGRASTVAKDGYLFDTGTIVLLPTYHRTLALVRAVGAASIIELRKPTLAIARAGSLHEIDLMHPVRSLFRMRLLSMGATLSLFRLTLLDALPL
jgi:protoporphyrinogen/coproporphyrinogen III oxidase